jgi:hypothetical protein
MKKLIMTAAVLACAGIVSAQVYSENIVGYAKDVASGAGFHISGVPFDVADPSPEGVFGSQYSLGTKIYLWTGSGYAISTYSSVFDYGTYTYVDQWDPNTLDLSSGNGFWIETVGAETAIKSGEVNLSDSVTNSIVVGFQLLSNPYPVYQTVAAMGFSPTRCDKVYAFTGTGYAISTYSSVFDYGTYTYVDKWDPDTLTIDVGEGFWYEAVSAQTWVATRPFTP